LKESQSPATADTTVRVWFNKCFSSVHGVLRRLREDWGKGLVLIGTHTEPDFGPLVACDICEQEPRDLHGREYISWCLDFCHRHGVNVFVPGRMRDIIADHREEFAQSGVSLILAGDGNTLRLLEDKGRFLSQLPEGVPAHAFHRVTTWQEFRAAHDELAGKGKRVCFKPAVGTFGLGFHIIDDRLSPLNRLLRGETHRISMKELEAILSPEEKFSETLVMEYLDGSEFSVDVLAHEGEVLSMVCRRKPMNGTVRITGTSRTAMVQEGQSQILAQEPDIEEMVRKLAQHFHLGGLFNAQFRTGAERPEKPFLLEINGRMSGGLPYVALSGVNLPLHAIRVALARPGEPLPGVPQPVLPLRVQERSEVFTMPPRSK
jgi:hypothetical protein